MTRKITETIIFVALAGASVYFAHMWWNWTMLSLHMALLVGFKIVWEHRKTLIQLQVTISALAVTIERTNVLWQEREARVPADRRSYVSPSLS